jgi:DNA-binding GntR family transcriptional regulator
MAGQFPRPPGPSERLAPEETEPDPRVYVQLATIIRNEINDGTRKPGSVISITILHEQYKLARQTCSKALRLLAGEGQVKRWTGYGYHVSRNDG